MSALPPAVGGRTDLRDEVYQPSTGLKPAFIGMAGPTAAVPTSMKRRFPRGSESRSLVDGGSVLMRKTYGHEYPRTLAALMAWSELDPSGPAVTDSAGTLDRRAFQNRVLCVAAGLRSAGVGPGARVALWLPNGAGYLAAIFACAQLGALAIHINTRFRMA